MTFSEVLFFHQQPEDIQIRRKYSRLKKLEFERWWLSNSSQLSTNSRKRHERFRLRP